MQVPTLKKGSGEILNDYKASFLRTLILFPPPPSPPPLTEANSADFHD